MAPPAGAGAGGGGVEHATRAGRERNLESAPPMRLPVREAVETESEGASSMWVLFVEAFGAVALLVLIVWWTMFHGRKKGERSETHRDDE